MSDTSNPFGGFPSFFFPNEQGTNLKLREKIALAQMMKKQAYPKTLGEGFASIGDSISDVITIRGLERADKNAQAVAAQLGAPQEAGAITPVSSAPTTATPVQAAAVAGGQDPTSQALVPPSVQEGGPPTAPGPMFRPNLRTSPVMTPAAPAVPAPPDVPGAIRMSTPEQLQDWRAQNPLPVPPPPTAPQRPSVADYGQKLVLAPTPPSGAPVMAEGSDDQRRDVALAMLRQGQTGQPPISPRPPAPAPAPQGVEVAPPDAFQRVTQAQPQAVPGYVPPELADPTRAVVIPPSKRERELQAVLNANQGNPYAEQSPAAMALKSLQADRAKQQALEDKKTEANISRVSKREEQRQQGLMDQARREAEVAETRQKLIDYGQTRAPAPSAGSDPRLGTQDSPQRSGIPTTPPVPAGVSPQKWAELQAPEHVKALSAAESATPDFQKMLDVIKLAREHPGKERIGGTGLTAGWAPGGTEAYDFSQVVEQLKGKNFLAGYQKLKGGGAVSEIEGTKTEQSQARLNPRSSTEAFNAGLDDLEKTIRGDLEQMQRKVNQPVTAWQRSPNDPPAPDKGQLSPGGTHVYTGGDPADKNSWRRK